MPGFIAAREKETCFSRVGMVLRRYSCPALLFVLLSCFAAFQVSAQEKNPYADDPKIGKLGEYQFRLNCAFCHGLGARGGGRGPDLTRAQKRHGNSDAEMFHTIHDGIAGTAMPAATNGGIGVGMSDEEIWQVVTYLRSIQVKAPAQPGGNAEHGKHLFNGAAGCSTCHMIQGKGGRLGPDLSTVGGSRSKEFLVESVRNPSRRLAQGIFEVMKEFPQEYESVSVVTADGTKLSGVVLNEDQFTLQMLDTREQLHLLEKDKLRSFEKRRESAMPAYDEKMLSDKDLEDLVAYLQTVGAQ
ncbi:MAG TPA: c-type cytochrome [Candidatus Dormibacteraeota bacterium]|nr:c-type cytochrome [Candidatus Dormibacteraeota bacterium]